MRRARKQETTTPAAVTLPAGIKVGDTTFPKFDSKDAIARDAQGGWLEFELWHVARVGWVIPTLLIRNPGRRSQQTSARTYATTLDGQQMRVGMGPHVTAQVRVYVRESRRAALQRFLDLRDAGAVDAHTIRDRISTRRAQGALRRAAPPRDKYGPLW